MGKVWETDPGLGRFLRVTVLVTGPRVGVGLGMGFKVVAAEMEKPKGPVSPSPGVVEQGGGKDTEPGQSRGPATPGRQLCTEMHVFVGDQEDQVQQTSILTLGAFKILLPEYRVRCYDDSGQGHGQGLGDGPWLRTTPGGNGLGNGHVGGCGGGFGMGRGEGEADGPGSGWGTGLGMGWGHGEGLGSGRGSTRVSAYGDRHVILW